MNLVATSFATQPICNARTTSLDCNALRTLCGNWSDVKSQFCNKFCLKYQISQQQQNIILAHAKGGPRSGFCARKNPKSPAPL
jgi:hypothetical protein